MTPGGHGASTHCPVGQRAMIITVTQHPALVVGRVDSDQLKVRVLGRMHPGSDDFWDGNWLLSPISARLGGFVAEIGAGLRVEELQRFRRGLEAIHRQLRGEATLTSMEQWISLTVQCRPNGSLSVTGTLADDPVPATPWRSGSSDLTRRTCLRCSTRWRASSGPIRCSIEPEAGIPRQ